MILGFIDNGPHVWLLRSWTIVVRHQTTIDQGDR
jgi:hypothetical protein